MDFSDALRMMKQGFQVRRPGWDKLAYYEWSSKLNQVRDEDGSIDIPHMYYSVDDFEIMVDASGLPKGVAKDLHIYPTHDNSDWDDYQPGDCAQATDGKWSVVLRRDESTITIIRRPSATAAQEYAQLVKEALKTPKVRRAELEDRRAKLEGELNVILVEIDSMGTVELNVNKPGQGTLDAPSPAIDFLCECGHPKSKHTGAGCMVEPKHDPTLVGKKDKFGDDLAFCPCLKKPDEIVETFKQGDVKLVNNVTMVVCDGDNLPHIFHDGTGGWTPCSNPVPVKQDDKPQLCVSCHSDITTNGYGLEHQYCWTCWKDICKPFGSKEANA